jgi:hypothetical protein
MEKTIPPFSFTVDRDEEKEEIKLQYQVIWHEETLTLMTCLRFLYVYVVATTVLSLPEK